MNLLFVHQGFPGQYRHLLAALLQQGGHQLVGMGCGDPVSLPKGLHYIRYNVQRGTTTTAHPWVQEYETKLIRAEACADAAQQLRQQGFRPDLICAHPGWGESLFLRDIWPDAPQLLYQEFWYQARNSDIDFDPEFGSISAEDENSAQHTWHALARSRTKNAHLHLALEAANWSVCPTQFQRSTFPQSFQSAISVIHDGINTNIAAPLAADQQVPLRLPDGTLLLSSDPIITFVNRTLEPYRGCHTFLRALPAILQARPDARVVIVGATHGVSYGAAAPGGSWKDVFWPELETQLDSSRVHFTGPLQHAELIQLLQRSHAHVYLTYPFVLSWSLLEAMACGAPVVGSATAPVQEVIRDGETGLLVDFFSPAQLAEAVLTLLDQPALRAELGQRASAFVLRHYNRNDCVSRHLQLINLVATGVLDAHHSNP